MSREGFLPQTWNIPISPSRGIGCVRGASMMEKGGEGTEHLDGCEIMEVRCHFSFSEFYRQEIWGPQRYHLVTISKFGCCVERDTVTYRNKYYYHHESVR